MATIFVSLTAGQIKDIPVIWYANFSGAKSLNCKVSIPPFFNSLSEDLASQTGTDSELVSFKEAEDIEASLIFYVFCDCNHHRNNTVYKATAKKMTEDETGKDYETAELDDITETEQIQLEVILLTPHLLKRLLALPRQR